MEYNDIVTLISTIGFPIVMTGVACWYIYHIDERHTEETKTLASVIQANTLAIQELKIMITDYLKRGD